MAYMQHIQQEKKEDLALKTLVCLLRRPKNGSSKHNFDAEVATSPCLGPLWQKTTKDISLKTVLV